MKLSNQLKNQHLLWRAGFGVSLDDIPSIDDTNTHKLLNRLMKASEIPPTLIEVENPFVQNSLMASDTDNTNQMSKEETEQKKKEDRKAVNKQSNEDIKQLTLDWMDEMTFSKARLREKMALFWHGHFACRENNSVYQQQLLDIIRRNALGNFGMLLTEVSKSASMLSFLNNQQNKKKKPNENFAREVMELFTLGRGNYTEQDVKEAARAFTGWQYEKTGHFNFNTKTHDNDTKTILGNTGNFNGDDVLSILLKQKQTSVFITQKIYRFFVNDTVNEQHVNWLSERFYKNDYNISKLMYDIFSSDWFYEPENIGIHFKSPVEYIIGIRTFLPMNIQNPEVQLLIQRLLGQWLFNPPNVAGWPGGKAWIDSSSLMLRLRIPSLMKNEDVIELRPKSNDDVQMGRQETFDVGSKKQKKKPGSPYQILARVDWSGFCKVLNEKDKTALLHQLKTILIQTNPDALNNETISMGSEKDDLIQFTQRITTALMSTPEYQLC
jgi:uncharacterized protein (DUF1800 family)